MSDLYEASTALLTAAQVGDILLQPRSSEGMRAYQDWAEALNTAGPAEPWNVIAELERIKRDIRELAIQAGVMDDDNG